MMQPACHVRVAPPHFDAHYCQITCHRHVGDTTHTHKTGVPSKQALLATVTAQRSHCITEADSSEQAVDVSVEIAPGFAEDLSEREVRGETTLGSYEDSPAFSWAAAQPAHQTYLRPVQVRHGQRALDLSVVVDGDPKRVFVGARSSGGFVATGDTGWLTNIDGELQTCRLVAALEGARSEYVLESARVVDLAGTPLASCQPFQRRSVMWTSPRSTPIQ
jgi:hypothetical protein